MMIYIFYIVTLPDIAGDVGSCGRKQPFEAISIQQLSLEGSKEAN